MTSALTTAPAAEAAADQPAHLIVHCGDLSSMRLDRRLQQVLTSIPPATRVTATVLRKPSRTTATLKRVRVAVIGDGGASVISRAVAESQTVVVLPYGAAVSGSWFEQLVDRATDRPDVVGVMNLGRNHLFVYPPHVTSLDAPREAWNAPADLLGKNLTRKNFGHRSLSAVLIVKDEEDNLPACLGSLQPIVDEVVVYDTGSRDGTIDLATSLGARVIRGYWDDDFGAARARALTHCETDWVLTVDADEVLVADRDDLRDWLDHADGTVAMVPVISHMWSGAMSGTEVRSFRLFSRKAATYAGALHEQLVAIPGQPKLSRATTEPPIEIIHSGYTHFAHVTKDKGNRNVAISRAAWEKLSVDDPRWAEVSIDLGRSLALSGDHEASISVLAPVLTAGDAVTPGNFLQGARTIIPILLAKSLDEQSREWIDRASSIGEAPGQIIVWRAQLAAQRGDVDAAVADLRELVAQPTSLGGSDYWDRAFCTDSALGLLAEIELYRGDLSEALAIVLDLLARFPDTVPTSLLLRASTRAGMDLHDLFLKSPEQYRARSLREFLTYDPELALAWYSTFAQACPTDPRPLIAASAVAARHSLEAALEWSVRALEAGLNPDVCALRTLADNDGFHFKNRTLAWALLVHGLGQNRYTTQLQSTLSQLSEEERDEVIDCLNRLLPGIDSL